MEQQWGYPSSANPEKEALDGVVTIQKEEVWLDTVPKGTGLCPLHYSNSPNTSLAGRSLSVTSKDKVMKLSVL